jgi:long-chain fatty acid transport protein
MDPALPDFHDVSFALGGRFRVAEPVHLAVGYTHLVSLFRDTTGRSEVTPDSGGVYWQTTGVVDANLDVKF